MGLRKMQRRLQEREGDLIAADAKRRWRQLLLKGVSICPHKVEVRTYDTAAENAADRRPAQVCEQCGKEKLIVSVFGKDA